MEAYILHVEGKKYHVEPCYRLLELILDYLIGIGLYDPIFKLAELQKKKRLQVCRR